MLPETIRDVSGKLQMLARASVGGAGGQKATIGDTDYAQHSLGDVVLLELSKPGANFSAGQTIGTMKPVKAVNEIYSPGKTGGGCPPRRGTREPAGLAIRE